jgi:phosphodiester glycosidase
MQTTSLRLHARGDWASAGAYGIARECNSTAEAARGDLPVRCRPERTAGHYAAPRRRPAPGDRHATRERVAQNLPPTGVVPRVRPAPTQDPRPAVERIRVALADGSRTTVYVARHDPERTRVRLAAFSRPQPLAAWSAARGIDEALVGGFFTVPEGTPLGELRTGGIRRRSVPFAAPWDGLRACLQIVGGVPVIRRRMDLEPELRGDLLQAGPLLVRDGRRAFYEDADTEGFSAGADQFDSDITFGRHPRSALAVGPGGILAVACDGRSKDDAGLSLVELADILIQLGAEAAINLDGGGSTSLVSGGRLCNRPRGQFGVEIPGGRDIATALVFEPRQPETRGARGCAPGRAVALRPSRDGHTYRRKDKTART